MQREQATPVLEEHDRLARRLQGQRPALRRSGDLVGAGGVHVRVLEQAQLELLAQQPPHGVVDRGLGHRSLLHLLDQRGIRLHVRELHVHGGRQRLARRVGSVRGHAVTTGELADGLPVRDDGAVEAPLPPQHVAEHPAVGVRGDAVDLVVRGHQAVGVPLLHGHLEGGEEDVAQRPLAEGRRAHVRPGLRLAVPGHVLQRGDHVPGRDRPAAPLQAAHRRQAHPRHEVRVLAVGFLDAPPARVARHVHHRGEHLLRAAGPHLLRDHGEGALHQVWVPRARQGDGLREAGRLLPLQPVQRLLVKDHGDAEARVVLHPPLDRVGELRLRTRPVAVARALDPADPHPEPLRRTGGVETPLGVGDLLLGVPEAQHLRHLLLQRHAREEVLHASRRWEARGSGSPVAIASVCPWTVPAGRREQSTSRPGKRSYLIRSSVRKWCVEDVILKLRVENRDAWFDDACCRTRLTPLGTNYMRSKGMMLPDRPLSRVSEVKMIWIRLKTSSMSREERVEFSLVMNSVGHSRDLIRSCCQTGSRACRPQSLHSPGAAQGSSRRFDTVPVTGGWEEVDGKAMACSGAVFRLLDRRGAHRDSTPGASAQATRAVDESFFVERVYPRAARRSVRTVSQRQWRGLRDATRIPRIRRGP